MAAFHSAVFEMLGARPERSERANLELDDAERRIGLRLPASVREWYSCKKALAILAEHSNADPPIPIREFTTCDSALGTLLPIRRENQGVCYWAVRIDGSDDPAVVVDVDSNGWIPCADRFSKYVYACVWDYRAVLHQPGLVQAQNRPLGPEVLQILRACFVEQPETYGWPGCTHRFAGDRGGILIWESLDQADWFVGSPDEASLTSMLHRVWNLDDVGRSFYDCSDLAQGTGHAQDRGRLTTELEAGAPRGHRAPRGQALFLVFGRFKCGRSE